LWPLVCVLQCVEVCCSVLQCVAVLQSPWPLACSMKPTHCNALQFTATRCSTATHCNSLQLTTPGLFGRAKTLQRTATKCNSLQYTATHCNSLQRRKRWCCCGPQPFRWSECASPSSCRYAAVCCSVLQYVSECVAVRCSVFEVCAWESVRLA